MSGLRAVRRHQLVAPLVALAAMFIVGWTVAIVAAEPLGLGDVDGLWSELFGWDAAWYRDIAAFGYGGVDEEGVRFFVLLPALGWLGDLLSPGDTSVPLLVAAWFGTAAGLWSLATVGTRRFGVRVGRVAVWVAVLWPASVALVLAYPTGWSVLATIQALDAIERRRWRRAAIWCVVAALARPTGALLIVPVALSWWRDRRLHLDAVAALAAPFSGLLAMAVISQRTFSDADRFADVQAPLRGDWVDPLSRSWTALLDLAGRDALDGLHLVFVLVVVALVIASVRRLPGIWTIHAVVVVLVITSVENWNSVERYAYDVPQLAFTAGLLLRDVSRSRRRTVAGLAAAAVTALVVLTVSGEFVP